VCTAFALPLKLSSSQPTSFPTFTLPILAPIPLGGSERVAVRSLPTGVKQRQPCGQLSSVCAGYDTNILKKKTNQKNPFLLPRFETDFASEVWMKIQKGDKAGTNEQYRAVSCWQN